MADQPGYESTAELEQALARLYHAPQPDPAFVGRLERRLLNSPPAMAPRLPLYRRLLARLAFQARLAAWAAAALLLTLGLIWVIEYLLPRQPPAAISLTPNPTHPSATRQASPTPPAPATPAAMLVPGDGLLAMMGPVNSLSQVYVLPAGGSTRIISDPARNAFSPALSPDGSRVAYAVQMDASREIVVADLSASKIIHLTQRNFDNNPFWSPDGRQIAFERTNQNNRTDLYLMDADGANLKPLLADDAQKTLDGWSPDGKSILFSSDLRAAQGNPNLPIRLQALDLAGGKTRELASFTTDQKAIRFALSPDGQKIAYEGLDNRDPAIFLMNLDGSGAQKLGGNQACSYLPVFSPDGQWLACSRAQNGEFGAVFISLVGEAAPVFTGPAGQITSWVASPALIQSGPAPLITPAPFSLSPTPVPARGDTSGWMSYRSEDLGFSILHPQAWSTVERDQVGYLYAGQTYSSAEKATSYTVAISEVANPDNLDIETLAKKDLTPAEKRSFSLVKTYIGSYTAFRTDSIPAAQGALTYFISAGHRVIAVALSPYNSKTPLPGQDETQGTFEAMLQTFRAFPRPTPTPEPPNTARKPVTLSISQDAAPLDTSQGMFYFMVRTLSAPVSRQLVRVSGACLLAQDSCPAQTVTEYPVGNDYPLSWSPDGRLAALAASDQTLLLDPQTGAWKTLTARYSAVDGRYRWSPDGSWLAAAVQFSGQAATEDAILLIRPDGSDEKLLASGLEDMKFPLGWLDSNTLLLIRDHTGIKGTDRQTRPGLFKLDTRTGEWSELTGDMSLNENHPELSPNGVQLAYTASGKAGLTFWDLNSQQVNSLSISGVPANWSPNGRWLAFVVSNQNASETWITHPDGAGRTKIFTGSAYPAVWAGSSQQLVLEVYPAADAPELTGVQLWLAPINGESPRQIVLPELNGSELLNPTWQPHVP